MPLFTQLHPPPPDYASMRNQRYLVPGSVHFITFRTEEGLPFVPLQFINTLICSALARAQRLYPVTIICFVVQANHVHLLVRVTDPEPISKFIGYFKAESAHYLIGRLGAVGLRVSGVHVEADSSKGAGK